MTAYQLVCRICGYRIDTGPNDTYFTRDGLVLRCCHRKPLHLIRIRGGTAQTLAEAVTPEDARRLMAESEATA